MLIRRETAEDIQTVRAVHGAAFAPTNEPGQTPVEVGLVDALRADDGWIPALSLVALDPTGGMAGTGSIGASHKAAVVGHVVCTRATIGGAYPALGLGPLGVLPEYQGHGVGSALMHAVLGAADALGESVVALLGHTDYYPRFGFQAALDLGIVPPAPEWGPHFQARPLSAYDPSVRGEFTYAKPFNDL